MDAQAAALRQARGHGGVDRVSRAVCASRAFWLVAHVPSIQGTSDAKLLRDGVMVSEGDTMRFTRNHLFRSPSMAAVALLGRTANGWLEWKAEDGQTLDAMKRRAIEGGEAATT